jgi:hypothetical protein
MDGNKQKQNEFDAAVRRDSDCHRGFAYFVERNRRAGPVRASTMKPHSCDPAIIVALIFLALFGCVGMLRAAHAAGSDGCRKDCRDYQQACLKAHSQGACKTDYEICVKACQKK